MAVNADTSQHPVEISASDGVEDYPHDSESLAAADQSEAAATRPSKTAPGVTRPALAVIVVVLAVLIGLGSWFGYQIIQDRRADAQRQMLVGVGRQAALNLTTIDANTVDADIKRILDSTTGTFHEDFQKRSGPFIDAVTETKSKTVGTVTEAALESQDGDDAQVLVAVAVKTSSAGVAEPQPRAWRMRITVTHHADQDAKASNVQFVP